MGQKNPATGGGLGRYQEAKDFFFGSMLKVNTTEPYSYSSLATLLGTGGIFILVGILAYLGGQIFNIVRSFHAGKSRRAMLIGAFGSSVAFFCLAYQMEALIAPTMVLFTILPTLAMEDFSLEIQDRLGRVESGSDSPLLEKIAETPLKNSERRFNSPRFCESIPRSFPLKFT